MAAEFEQGRLRPVEWLLLACVILLAVVLRMGEAGVVEFKRDEANLSLLALDVGQGRDFPLLGIGSSVGLPNAPVNVYVLAIPYIFSTDPQIATQFIGLLNVLAVVLVYFFGRRYGGPVAGLVAALLFAVNPWAIIFSRKIWAQNMLPVFVMLVAWAGVLGFIEKKSWARLLFLPLVVITGQIHYGAFVIIPMSLYVLWHGRRLLWTRSFLGSVVLALLMALPYLIGLARADLLDPQRISELVGQNQSEAESGLGIGIEALRSARLLIAGTEVHSLAGPEKFSEYLAGIPDVYPVLLLAASVILAGVAGLGLGWFFRHEYLRRPVDGVVLLGLWFPIVIFSINWTEFFIHYLIPMFPFVFLAFGFMLQDMRHATAVRLRRVRAGLLVGSVSGILLVCVIQVMLSITLNDFLRREYTAGGFGAPLLYLEDVREAAQDSGQPIIGEFEDGGAVGIHDEATIWAALLYDVDSVRFELPNMDVFPAQESLVLNRHCDDANSGMTFELRSGEGCYQLSERSVDQLDVTDYREFDAGASPLRFANGAELRGWQWDEVPACVSVWWAIHAHSTADYFFAVQFLDESGDQVASGDGLSWYGAYWRPGDQVLSRYCAGSSAEVISGVRLGMYTYDGQIFGNVDLVDELGNASGQSVVIGDF